MVKANKIFNKKNVLYPQKGIEQDGSVTATTIKHLDT